MSCARWAMVIRWLLTDTNFPAEGLARKSSFGRLLRIDNVPAAAAAQAVLSLMPFVTFFDDFAMRMQVVGAPHEFPPVQKEGGSKSIWPKRPSARWSALKDLPFMNRPNRPMRSFKPVRDAFMAASSFAKAWSRPMRGYDSFKASRP